MSNLEVSFPKSSEDDRLQLVEINGSIFAIVHSLLESDGPINLHCDEWSLILLAPIKSDKDIVISGINVICLNEISSKNGKVSIKASHRFVNYMQPGNSLKKKFKIVAKDEFRPHEDIGSLLYYHQLYHGIVTSVRSRSPSSISDAQQKFIGSLCVLADKIKGGGKDLNIRKALSFWNIS